MSELADTDGPVSYRYLNSRLDAIGARIISGEGRDVALGDSIKNVREELYGLGRHTDRRCKAAEANFDAVRNDMQRKLDATERRLDRALNLIYCLGAAVFGLTILVALL